MFFNSLKNAANIFCPYFYKVVYNFAFNILNSKLKSVYYVPHLDNLKASFDLANLYVKFKM